LQAIANIISITSYDENIFIINSEGGMISNKFKDYEVKKLPALATIGILIKNRLVLKLIDGSIKEFEYE